MLSKSKQRGHDGSFSGRIALVTGGSRGIGAAIAVALARQGAYVYVNFNRRADAAQLVVEQLIAEGGEGTAIQASLTDPNAVDAMFLQIKREVERLDILVNNAAIMTGGLLTVLSENDWLSTIDADLNSVFRCTKRALELMIPHAFGRIVNISSITALAGGAGQSSYAAAKAAIMALTRAVALEVSSNNIRVNCVLPGVVDTEMVSNIPNSLRQRLVERIPLARTGKPSEIAEAVLFLLSESASYIQGACLTVDGGLSIC